MKKIFITAILFTLVSCSNWMSEEAKTSGKAAAASSRINNSEANSNKIFKDLDE